jgi:hypothetical protein
VLQGLIPQGIVGPYNALMKDYCEAIDVDASGYLIPEPPPPQPPSPPPGQAESASPAPGGGGEVPDPQQVPQELQQ